MLVLVVTIFFESLRKIWGFWENGLQNVIETSPTGITSAPSLDIPD
jgi:hypothetical protein